MNFELTIRGDSFEEIASIFNRTTAAPASIDRGEPDVQTHDVQTHDAPRETAKEVEPEAEAPKPARTRRGSAKQDTAASETKADTSDTGPAATTAASPSEEKVTFEDIRALASSLMDSGKVEARAIQDMLVAKFDARAFGALKEEQYADCLAELQNLG